MNQNNKYLIVIAGPTAVGKTALAIKLAKYFNTEIISADSRQFYKETSIGTAKPSPEELDLCKHHFINNKSILENYSVGDYEKEAMATISELFQKQNILLLVGGSGLYINAILYGIDDFETVSEDVKAIINTNYETKGIIWLQEELKKRDPDYYTEVDKNNPQRLMRALEICFQTNLPYSSFLQKKKVVRPFEAIKIFIQQDREELYLRINSRVDLMIKEGLVEEAKVLYPHKHLNALNTVGYKELFAHFDGQFDLENAIHLIKQKTRNYAKRQITWFKNQDEFEVFHPNEFEKIKAYIEIILQNS